MTIVALFRRARIGAARERVIERLLRLLQFLHDVTIPIFPLLHPEQPTVHQSVRMRHDQLYDQGNRIFAHACHLVFERADRGTRNGEPLFGEFDG